ncbi:MAG: DUF4296 domain-containing protein [Flavobacteriaceae bacterium]
MFKQTIFFLSILLAFSGCSSTAPKKPKNLLSKVEMVNILIDAKLLNSANGANKTILRKNGIDADTYVFEKYGIDSLQFAQSNAYYAYHIKDYEAIYNMVTDSLKRLTIALKKEEKRIKDSIQIAEEKAKQEKQQDSVNGLDNEN